MSTGTNYSAGFPVSINHLGGGSPTGWFCANTVMQTMFATKQPTQKDLDYSFSQRTTLNLKERIPSSASCASSAIPQYSQLHIEACSGQLQAATCLLETLEVSEINKQDHNGNTSLMWATSQGLEDMVQLLIDNNADVNCQNFAGETALIIASSRGSENLCGLLLEHGADPNLSNLDGVTPLHFAAAAGHAGVVQLLVTYGAHVNSQDDTGDAPLHYAVREQQEKIVELLVRECNACVDLHNEDQESPLNLASCLEYTVLVEFLSKFSSGASELMDETSVEESGHEGNLVVFSWARQL